MSRKGELEGDGSPASNQIISRRAFRPGSKATFFRRPAAGKNTAQLWQEVM